MSREVDHIAIVRRRQADRLAPYLLLGMRFANRDDVKHRGEFTENPMRTSRFCDGGCGAVLTLSGRSAAPAFLCSDCLQFALDAERKIRKALGLLPIEEDT